MVHCRVHNRHILSQMNLVHASSPASFRSILISWNLCPGLPMASFLFSIKFCTHFSFPRTFRMLCILALFNIITRIENVGLPNSWSPSVSSFLRSPDTHCPSAQNTLRSTFCLQSAVLATNTCSLRQITRKNSVALVRMRTIPTERPPPVGEVSANFCG